MKNGRIALTVTMSTLAVALTIGATANQQDLTDQAAVQDAVVNFGHPVHPQPPAPANHTLHPDEVTIVKGGTVTFTMNGPGHGVAIYPVSKNTTRAHISEDLCQGSMARHLRTQRPATLRTEPRPCRTRSPTGTAKSSSTLLKIRRRDKSTPLRDNSSQQAGFQVYC